MKHPHPRNLEAATLQPRLPGRPVSKSPPKAILAHRTFQLNAIDQLSVQLVVNHDRPVLNLARVRNSNVVKEFGIAFDHAPKLGMAIAGLLEEHKGLIGEG